MLNKKLLISLTAVLILTIATTATVMLYKSSSSNVSTNIPELVLPRLGEPTTAHINLKLGNTVAFKKTEKMPVYKFKDINVKKNDFLETANKFGINGEVKDYKVEGAPEEFFINDGEKIFKMEKITGKIYAVLSENYQKETVKNSKKNIPSNDECKKIASQFLINSGWDNENFKFDSFGEGKVTPGDKNPETDGEVIEKTVIFIQYVDGKKVLGNSKIMVSIGHNGEIEAAQKYYRPFEKVGEYKIKDIKTALTDVTEGKASHDITGSGENAIVNEVDILYYEDAEGIKNPYLQPVYHLSGEYKDGGKKQLFNAVVPAIEQ